MDDKYYLVNNLKDSEKFKNIIKNEIFNNDYNSFFDINNDKFIEYLQKYKNRRSIDNSNITTHIFTKFDHSDVPTKLSNIYEKNNYHKKFNSNPIEKAIKALINFILKNRLNYKKLDENQIQYIYLMLAPSDSITTGYITSTSTNTTYFILINLFKFIYGKYNQWLTKQTNFGIRILKNTNHLNFMFLNFNKKPSHNREMGFIFPNNNIELINSIINATLLFEFIELTVDYINDKESTLFDLNNQKTYIVKNDNDIFNFIERGNNFNYLIDFDANRNKGEKKNMKKNVQLNLIKKQENDKINKFICLANDHKSDQTTKLYHNLFYHPNMNSSYYSYPANKHEIDYDFKQFLNLKRTNNKLYSSYNLNTKLLENICNQEQIQPNGYGFYSKNRNDIQELMTNSDIICLQEANIKDFNLYKLTEVVNSVDKPIKIKVVIDNDFEKGLKSKNIKEFLRINNIEYLNKNFFINIYKSKKYTENGLFSDKNLIYISNRLASYQDNDGTNKNSIKKFNITLFSNKIKLKDNDIYIGKIGNGWDYTHTHTFTAIKLNNHECIINIHLDTDDSKRIKQTELKILFNKIISRNKFFDKIKKIIVTGDFNMDTVDIIDILYSQIKSSFYINKKFRILFNNIVTGNKTSLDNCIIIEENNDNNKCDPPVIFEPNIYVTANKYHVNNDSIIMYKDKSNTKIIVDDESIKKEKEKLSDHSLISYYIDNDDSSSILKGKKEKNIKVKKSDESDSIDNKSSKTNSIKTNSTENNSNKSESPIQEELSTDEIDTLKYEVIETNPNIHEIINTYLMNYNKFKEFIICLSKTTPISSLDFIDFNLEDKLNKLNLKLNKLNKLNKKVIINPTVNYLVIFPQLQDKLTYTIKKIEIQSKLLKHYTDMQDLNKFKKNYKLTNENKKKLSELEIEKIELESKIINFKPIYFYIINKNKLEENIREIQNELDKQNEKILNLKNNYNIKILLKELIDDFNTSSNTNEENILKKIFLKCNIKLFLITNKQKYKHIDNELKLNNYCLIKNNIDSKITYSLIKKNV
tara:strand:- start:2275 stop:5391 length:3117 start_codon:yes stop_codon:yes gene_type:complete